MTHISPCLRSSGSESVQQEQQCRQQREQLQEIVPGRICVQTGSPRPRYRRARTTGAGKAARPGTRGNTVSKGKLADRMVFIATGTRHTYMSEAGLKVEQRIAIDVDRRQVYWTVPSV